MSITKGYCPSGIMQFRRAYPVSADRVTDGSRKGLKVATCTVCNRPNVTVVLDDTGVYRYSGHTESVAESSARPDRRHQTWT